MFHINPAVSGPFLEAASWQPTWVVLHYDPFKHSVRAEANTWHDLQMGNVSISNAEIEFIFKAARTAFWFA